MGNFLLGAGYILGLFGLAALVLIAKDRFESWRWAKRNPPERLEALQREYRDRLGAPDWIFYASHLQRPVPEALVSWYTKASEGSAEFAHGEYAVEAAPLDRRALEEAWVVPGVVPFAHSDSEPIYLKPGPHNRDGVYITFHDGGETEVLAPSVEAFVQGLATNDRQTRA